MKWALLLALAALVAGLLDFAGQAASPAAVARLLFVALLIAFMLVMAAILTAPDSSDP